MIRKTGISLTTLKYLIFCFLFDVSNSFHCVHSHNVLKCFFSSLNLLFSNNLQRTDLSVLKLKTRFTFFPKIEKNIQSYWGKSKQSTLNLLKDSWNSMRSSYLLLSVKDKCKNKPDSDCKMWVVSSLMSFIGRVAGNINFNRKYWEFWLPVEIYSDQISFHELVSWNLYKNFHDLRSRP